MVLLGFGVICGCVTATTLLLSGAGLGLALLGYMAGTACGGLAVVAWLLLRASLAPVPQRARVTARLS